ncbi:MAG: FHA domain-containing protein [bacterium]
MNHMDTPKFKIGFNGNTLVDFTLSERGKEYRIGRASENDIVVDDPRISRYHFTLLWDWNDAVVITDLGGANGIIVNGLRVEHRIAILPSDTVLLGNLDLIHVIPDQPIEPVPLPSDHEEAVKPVAAGSANRVYVALFIGGIIIMAAALVMIAATLF